MTTYRTAVPADEPGIFAIWSVSLSASLDWLRTDWEGIADRFQRTFVAVDGDGVAAVVVYAPRLLRDGRGEPVRVGGVAAVATRPDARRRGHARELLVLAADAMRADGCAWSLLFTGTPEVYSSLGWRPFPVYHRTARAVAGREVPGVRLGSIADLPPLHEAFNARRPLTAVRSAVDWAHGVRQRLGCVFVYEDTGYAAVAKGPQGLRITEMAVTEPKAADVLISHAVAWAGDDRVLFEVPYDPLVEPALARSFTEFRTREAMAMARPLLSDPMGLSDLPGAVFWPADGF